MKKLSLIKVVGVLAICLMTFFNSQFSNVLSENQGTLDLNKLVSMTQANAEVVDLWCLGWGFPCTAIFRPEQTQVFPPH